MYIPYVYTYIPITLLPPILTDVSVEFSPAEYSVSESDGFVVLTLVANREASFEYSVNVDTADINATGKFLYV